MHMMQKACAMREMKINKQVSSLLLLVIVLMILSRLLR